MLRELIYVISLFAAEQLLRRIIDTVTRHHHNGDSIIGELGHLKPSFDLERIQCFEKNTFH